MLNGITSEEVLGDSYGMNKILYCVAQGMDTVKEGNKLTYSNMGKLCFGEKNNAIWSEKVKKVAEFFNETSLPYEVPLDMSKKQWRMY